MNYVQSPLKFVPGINPIPDETEQNTIYFVDGDNVRFVKGMPESIGGHRKLNFQVSRKYDSALAAISTQLDGCPRNIHTYEASGSQYTMVGTHKKLYAIKGSVAHNITPLQTSGTTLGTNPITTRYDNVQTNPFTTTSGSNVVVLSTFLYDEVIVGDTVTVSGVSGAINGIPDTELNASHTVIGFFGNNLKIKVTTEATSSGSPTVSGVVTVLRAVKVTHTSHSLAAGDRVKLSGATGPIGGVPASEINKEHIVSVVETADTYVVSVSTDATSFASGGGASVVELQEIADGACDAAGITGWGVGLWGSGLWGVSQTNSSLLAQPRIWSMDNFGSTLILTPGNDTGAYYWNGDTATAPTLITGGTGDPTTVNWLWVDKSIVVTLGANDGSTQKDNRIKNSNIGDYTDWDTTATGTRAYQDDKEDAVKLISGITVRDENIVFAEENKVFSLRFIGGSDVWDWQQVSESHGLIGPNARIEVNGLLYFMGKDNFYYYNGGIIEPLPNNTLLNYVFDNINRTQSYKCFVWHNRKFDELHFHYPSAGSTENDRAVIFSIPEQHWSKRSIDRTAGEQQGQASTFPLLADSSGNVYQHENGVNDDTAALSSYVETAFIGDGEGDFVTRIKGVEVDGIINGTLSMELRAKNRPNDAEASRVTVSLTSSTKKKNFRKKARYWSWKLFMNEVGGSWRIGRMKQFLQRAGLF